MHFSRSSILGVKLQKCNSSRSQPSRCVAWKTPLSEMLGGCKKCVTVCYSDAKSVRISIVFGPHLPTFKQNTKIYRANLHIHSEYGKIRTRKAPNTDNFYAMFSAHAVQFNLLINLMLIFYFIQYLYFYSLLLLQSFLSILMSV